MSTPTSVVQVCPCCDIAGCKHLRATPAPSSQIRQGLETGDAKPDNASKTAGGPAPENRTQAFDAEQRAAQAAAEYVHWLRAGNTTGHLSDHAVAGLQKHFADVIRALPAPQTNLMGWRDISTAPKTGEEFIGRTGTEWSGFSCFWDGEAFVHLDLEDGVIRYTPTEWMSMPGPSPDPQYHVAGTFHGAIDTDTPLQAAAREAGWALTTLIDISDWQKRDQLSDIIGRLAAALLMDRDGDARGER